MHKSIWTQSITLPTFPTLTEDKKTDVLIIGGGICGILCAYFFKQLNIDYILVEAGKIASGTTKNTTAKITSQHGLVYDKIITDFGKEMAHMYLTANQNALSEYEKLCQNIDCDFEKKPAYTYTLNNRKKVEKEVKALNSIGFNAQFQQEPNLPFHTQGAVKFDNQAQFNPLKFISHISQNLNIYENTFIKDIKPASATSQQGKISAKHIIVATHFPFINRHGSYFLKLYQHRSYVSAYKNAPKLDGMYVDENDKGMSFRNYKDFLLIGGGAHRTGKKGLAWAEINKFTNKYYKDAQPEYEWSAQDCMSLDSIPYIGRYSKKTPYLYVATGFNKWGITNSMVAAKILCDMISEKSNDYASVFSPQRSILKPQLFINGLETGVNLLTPTPKRCPHLGCALKWNKPEHSWDCPCHGSRFSENGKLIDNPATGDANIN